MKSVLLLFLTIAFVSTNEIEYPPLLEVQVFEIDLDLPAVERYRELYNTYAKEIDDLMDFIDSLPSHIRESVQGLGR